MEEEEKKGDLGKDNDVLNSDPKGKNVVLNSEIENNGIEHTPPLLCWRNEEDVEVDIIGNSGFKGVENSCMDHAVVENSSSSSFGDACCGYELTDSDEAESSIRDDRSTRLPRLRKRKMTDHWKKYIFPLKRRCKWVETQLRKLNYQAKKYEEAIAAYDQQKQLRFLMPAGDDFNIKSVPVTEGIQRNEVMRRKKRKRVEECDLSSYMSNHCLFSYYENKNRDHDGPVEDSRNDVMSDVDNAEEFKLNDTRRPSVDHCKDTDKSFIDIIKKIEELSSHVENLKTRINTVINENPGRFESVTQLNTVGPSHHNSELCAEDQLLNDNPLSTCEGITPSIEAANTTQFEIKEEVPDQYYTVKEELNDVENSMIHLQEEAKVESKESVEEQKFVSPVQVSASDMVTKNVVPNVRSIKPCSTSSSPIPKNTRSARKRPGP